MKAKLSVSTKEFKAQSLEDASLSRACELFETHGALWLQNVFSRSFIEMLGAAYEQKYTSQSSKGLRKKHAVVGDQRFMVTVKLEFPFNTPELYANPILKSILDRLLGVQHAISSFGSVVTFPGAEAQPIHVDYPPLFESETTCVSLPAYAITIVVPLVDIDHETGSTAIWEGSHRCEGGREQLHQLMESPSFEGSVHPLPKMGDVYLMDYRVIHGGMENQSEQSRPILYLVYGRPWFTDAFNFNDQPAIEFEKGEFKKVPKRHRDLFKSYRR
jgi:ectoine hydroxylase-related dioxygenase (phytanoyl-CoA dioxygenase family)